MQGGFEATLLPVILVESTAQGWRGLTKDGQILNVESANGHVAEPPLGGSLAVNRKGQRIGSREIPAQLSSGVIDEYLRHFDAARSAIRNRKLADALSAVDEAIATAPTLLAEYNRSMILLEMGEWDEGFDSYMQAMETEGSIFMRPHYKRCLELGMERWRGENLEGKKILLIHDHGFGDTIMTLRFVWELQARGAEVVLWLPPELKRLGEQIAPVVTEPEEADYFCPVFLLMRMLGHSPYTIPLQPYLKLDPDLIAKWREQVFSSGDGRRTVGIAWLPGNTGVNDYPRTIELEHLVKGLPTDVRLISVQSNDDEKAKALGVETFEYEDFADCAACMMCCDEIVTVDTAAIHLAGAINHPNAKLLLSYWHSWRWLSPLYDNIKICMQTEPGDWNSALAKLSSGIETVTKS